MTPAEWTIVIATVAIGSMALRTAPIALAGSSFLANARVKAFLTYSSMAIFAGLVSSNLASGYTDVLDLAIKSAGVIIGIVAYRASSNILVGLLIGAAIASLGKFIFGI